MTITAFYCGILFLLIIGFDGVHDTSEGKDVKDRLALWVFGIALGILIGCVLTGLLHAMF